ncbi:glycoside hydrolase family 32 protein [Paenibacillus sp. FSL R10-2199]|uniref:glycoside hydrolase family 32 protein n=1 Tax=Paenibacillus sp. FSL R10-2199 TaxID=2975348 RepID=UPI0030F50908
MPHSCPYLGCLRGIFVLLRYHPHSSIWGPMHWGHAVSKDLISWEELDIALYPDEHGYASSGSAAVDWNNTSGLFPENPGIVAVYTSYLEPTETSPAVQRQSLAYSHDNGRTWIKYAGNPVLTHPSKADFRDPKVFWSEAHGKWIMVLATDQTITFYSSPNLREWHTELIYSAAEGTLTLRRDSGKTGFSEIFPDLQSTGGIGSLKNLRILLDACSVEVFANDGLSAITSLVFPRRNLLGPGLLFCRRQCTAPWQPVIHPINNI